MALPTPLETGRDYYVIHESDTQIKLADTLQDAMDGIPIDLEDNGDTDVTLVRQNTAEFKLKLEPASWAVYLNQLPMGVDFQNKVQPASLYISDPLNPDGGEGGVSWHSDYSFLVLGFIHIDHGEGNNFVTSVQRSRVNRHLNICQWNFWTIENSIALCEFGDETTDFRSMVKISNGKIWIATNEGIYEYDPLTPSTPPSLLTIPDLISTDIKDMVCLENSTYFGDERDSYVWTGHSTGITRIDPTDGNSCKKYITGEGEELEDLTAGYENIKTGTMSISATETAVRVLICGCLAEGSTGSPWVIEDGSGYLVITTLNDLSVCGSLRKYTNHIAIVAGHSTTLYLYNITVTGKNTGTIDVIESFATGTDYGVSNKSNNTQMVQVNDTTFVFGTMSGYPNYYTHIIFYEIGVGIDSERNYYTQVPGNSAAGWKYAFPRYHLDAFQDAKGDIINVPLQYDMRPMFPPSVAGYKLGILGYNEDTNSWCIERSGLPANTRTARKLRSSNSLYAAIAADANNAVGKDWDTQFVANDHFTFMHGFAKFKDNLQTMLLRFRSYGVNAFESTRSITIPNSDPAYYQAPESIVENYPDFREIDNYDLVTIVDWNGSRFTQYSPPAGSSFTVSGNTLNVGVDIATNTPIYVYTNDWRAKRLPYPLRYQGVYFAIRIDATSIQLSLTPGGAAITLTDTGVGNYLFSQIVPTVGTYFLGMNGIFIFSQDDVEKNVDLRYIVTGYN